MSASPLLSKLASRIHEEDVSFRTKMLEIAATIPDVIALGRGDPDFHTPHHIVEAAKKAIDDNQHHYTLPTGMPPLRQAIAAHLREEYKLDYSADEIVVTAGVQESIMLCMLGLVEAGDEVLITSPRFTSYDTAVILCGGVPVPVPTYEEDDFALMPKEIEARITPRTKILVLVTPNNPTGAVTPPAVIKEIADLAERHNLIVFSDEIYAKLIYEGSEHLSIATLPGMKERTITFNGFSKTYAMTGWRVGYIAAPAPFVRALTEPRHTLSINTSTPSQFAALAALTGPQDPVNEMLAAYAERRTFLMKALTEMGLTYGHPGGAFYIYTNVTNTGMAAPKFCEELLRHTGVLIFPGELFGDPSGKYLRISYLQPLPRIEDAVARMGKFIAEKAVKA
ncbi:aminotransferase class I/II-fold pyridoxal phosphate-dependent enzyme [bacterium]|nr:aminotransferase class I/II-fold pyridoxal phosphate-dependent enzyme [bacterium]